MYRRLLIPVDQPGDVEPLIRFGSMILDADGEIRVLHVIPTTSLPEVTREWRASVNLVVPAHEAGAALDVRVDPEVRAAVDVPGEILESAETHSVDAILMTLRGDRRSRNPFIGHTASAVLHHASCDVLVVNRLALVAERVGKILLPTFGPAPPAKGMRLAEELAVRYQGIPLVSLAMGSGGEGAPHWLPPVRSARGLTIEHRRSPVTDAILGRRHRLPELILAAAARERYGLLLVAEDPGHTEGPLLTRRFLEDLFRSAPCPVAALRG